MSTEFSLQIHTKSDAELVDIYLNDKDYQPEFVAVVTETLQQRGLSLEALIAMRNERYAALDAQLAAGRPGSTVLIGLGYVSALLGGIAGIVVGYIYYRSTQPSVDGQQRYYLYDGDTRRHGRNILVLGLVVLAALLLRAISDTGEWHA